MKFVCTMTSVVATIFGLNAFATGTAQISGDVLTVEVVAGETNTLDEVTGGDAAIAALQSNGVTDFIKKGAGGLKVSTDISGYTGTIHVDEGTYRFTTVNSLGSIQDTAGGVYVADKATLDNAITTTQASLGAKAVTFGGFGVNGVGALLLSGNVDQSQGAWGGNLVMTSPARIAVLRQGWAYLANGGRLNMNGHDLEVGGTGYGLVFSGSATGVSNPGNVIVKEQASIMFSYLTKAGAWDNAAGKTLTVTNLARVYFNYTQNNPLTWSTVYATDRSDIGVCAQGEFSSAASAANTNYQRFGGPVKLLKTMLAQISKQGPLVFGGEVSGPYGITVTNAANAAARKLHLAAVNSYEGSVTSHGVDVDVWKNGSLPADSAGVILHDASLYFHTGTESLALPSITLDGTSSVHDGFGAWSGSIVKTGGGTAVYGSSANADTVDVHGGTLEIAGTPGAVTNIWCGQAKGLVAGAKWITGSAVYADYLDYVTNSEEVVTNTIKYGISTANSSSDDLWKCPGAEGDNTYKGVVTMFDGYIWNHSPTNENWSFVCSVNDRVRLLMDGTEVFLHKQSPDSKATVCVTPGPHKFHVRVGRWVGAWSKTWGGPRTGVTDIIKQSWEAVGLCVDFLGRDSWELNKYVQLTGDYDQTGRVFTWALPNETAKNPITGEVVASVCPSFRAMKFANGATLDLADGYGRTCDTLSGFGEITGSPEVKVLSAWTVNADDLAPDMDAFTVDGQIVFSDGAQLVIADFTAHRKWTGARTFTIMTARDGIEGCPELSASGDNWSLAKSQDGKSLLLSYRPNGMILLLR